MHTRMVTFPSNLNFLQLFIMELTDRPTNEHWRQQSKNLHEGLTTTYRHWHI